jgi:hypothetical protein
MESNPDELLVIVCGAGAAGSTAASLVASRGARVIVIERNARPYGRVDLIPHWRAEYRDSERAAIDLGLSHPGIEFVPRTEVGVDISFSALRAFDPDLIIMATGADERVPLPVLGEGGDDLQSTLVVDAGSLLKAHIGRPQGYPNDEARSGAIVLGDGPDAIECARVLLYDLCREAFRARGMSASYDELAGLGALEAAIGRGLTLDSLGIVPPRIMCEGDGRGLFGVGPDDEFTREAWFDLLCSRDGILVIPFTMPLAIFARAESGASGFAGVRVSSVNGESVDVGAPLIVDARAPKAGLIARTDELAHGGTVLFEGPPLTLLIGRAAEACAGPEVTHATSTSELESVLVRLVGSAPVAKRQPGKTAEMARPDMKSALAWALERQRTVGYSDYADWIFSHRKLD